MIENIILAIEWTTFICAIITFVIGVRYRGHSSISHLYLYPMTAAIQIALVIFPFPETLKIQNLLFFQRASVLVFMILEVSVIFWFFLKVIKKSSAKKCLWIILVCFTTYLVTDFYTEESLIKKPLKNYFIDSLIILIPCYYYLFELFQNPKRKSLWTDPSFWVTTGLTSFFSLSIPVYVLAENLRTSSYRFSVIINLTTYLGYIFIFSLLSKAFLCQTKMTKF